MLLSPQSIRVFINSRHQEVLLHNDLVQGPEVDTYVRSFVFFQPVPGYGHRRWLTFELSPSLAIPPYLSHFPLPTEGTCCTVELSLGLHQKPFQYNALGVQPVADMLENYYYFTYLSTVAFTRMYSGMKPPPYQL